MVENSETTPGIAIYRAVVLTLVWVFFVGALVISARVGILLARLDSSETGADPSKYTAGTVVTIDGSGRPVPLAEDPVALREHYFRLETGVSTGAEEEIVEIPIAVTAHTLRQDLDLVEVKILTGEQAGRQLWVRRDLLPDPAPAVAGP